MGKKASKGHAASFLGDVPGDRLFWCVNGMQFENLESLSKSLGKIIKTDFTHHVNTDKNDFANWIYDVIGDVWLATELRKTTKKTDISRTIRSRVSELKKVLK